jgi:signal transduction histidine kinase
MQQARPDGSAARQRPPGVAVAARSTVGELTAKARQVLAGPEATSLLAIVLSVGVMVEVTVLGSTGEDPQGTMVFNLGATLSLFFARRFLLVAAALVVFGVLVTVADLNFASTVSAIVALVFVLYLVACHRRRHVSVLFALPFLLNVMVPFSGQEPSASSALLLVLVAAAQLLGDMQRQKGTAILERDNTLQAMADSAREQAAMAERARIARELHDVVAHHLSVIAVQAEAGRLASPDLSDAGTEQFQTIARAAREALTEMRRVLGVLREASGDEAEREPQPGLEDLPALIETAREAGTPVRLTLQGRVEPLPPGVNLTAYRIVQEALTNTRRHAPGAPVDLDLTYDVDALHMRIQDHGPGPTARYRAGHGLLGMEERIAMVGGSLRAGPAGGGGFQIEAELPIRDAPS